MDYGVGHGISGGIYAVFGGLRAVAISDSINGLGLLIGGLLIPVLGLAALGDGNIFAGWGTIVRDIPKKQLDPLGAEGDNIPFGTLFTGMLLLNIYYWCTNQSIVQRTFGAKSLKEGQKGILIATCLKLAGPIYLVLPGIIALQMFGPELRSKTWLTASLVAEVLPPALVGFFGAVIFGAILSSFNSVLHSSSTLFGLDIYRGMIKPEATDEETVRVGKRFGIIMALVAMSLAPFIGKAESLFTLMKMLAIANVPILAIIYGYTNDQRFDKSCQNFAIYWYHSLRFGELRIREFHWSALASRSSHHFRDYLLAHVDPEQGLSAEKVS